MHTVEPADLTASIAKRREQNTQTQRNKDSQELSQQREIDERLARLNGFRSRLVDKLTQRVRPFLSVDGPNSFWTPPEADFALQSRAGQWFRVSFEQATGPVVGLDSGAIRDCVVRWVSDDGKIDGHGNFAPEGSEDTVVFERLWAECNRWLREAAEKL